MAEVIVLVLLIMLAAGSTLGLALLAAAIGGPVAGIAVAVWIGALWLISAIVGLGS